MQILACGEASRQFSSTAQRQTCTLAAALQASDVASPLPRRSAVQSEPVAPPGLGSSEPEPMSTVEHLLQKSHQHQRWRNKHQSTQGSDAKEARPVSTSARRAPSHRLYVTMKQPAGSLAALLTWRMRAQGNAEVAFSSILSIFKCLRVLCITNIFLEKVSLCCSFVFVSESSAQDYQHMKQLIKDQKQQMQRRQGRQQLAPGWHHDMAPTSGPAPRAALAPTPGTTVEPAPLLPYTLFRLHAWARQLPPPLLTPHGPGAQGAAILAAVPGARMHGGQAGAIGDIQVLDFALDLRQPWRKMAYISFDMAFSIADNIYTQLVAQLPPPCQPVAPSTSSSLPAPLQSSQGASQVGAREALAEKEPRFPTLVCSTDITQAVLIFTALFFVQQRLQRESIPQKLVVTVMRSGPPAAAGRPRRLDGRRGNLIQLELQPAEHVRLLRRRKRMSKSQQQQQNLP